MSVHITNSHSGMSGAQDGCYNFGKSGGVIEKLDQFYYVDLSLIIKASLK